VEELIVVMDIDVMMGVEKEPTGARPRLKHFRKRRLVGIVVAEC
jgi:hypothetical protein